MQSDDALRSFVQQDEVEEARGRARPLVLTLDGAAGGGPGAGMAPGGASMASIQGSSLSSPIRVDRLAVLADIVTSPEGLARLAGGTGAPPYSSPGRKRPRLNLDIAGLVRSG